MEILCLFTNSFPFGQHETFLENEIDYMSRRYDKVYVFPDFIAKGASCRSLPASFDIVNYESLENSITRPGDFYFQRGLRYKLFLQDLMLHKRKKIWNIKSILFNWNLLNKEIYKSSLLSSWLKLKGEKSKLTLYSYWFGDKALRLALLKQAHPSIKWFSRVHGYDLYDHRHEMGTQTFRSLKVSSVDKVYTVSDLSKAYLRNRLSSKLHEKVDRSYLGVSFNHDVVAYSNNEFTLLSCSDLISLKRVSLIINVLKGLKFPIVWHHFGDGVLENNILNEAKLLPENVKLIYHGRVENIGIVDEFLKTNANLFIHLSETEGLPVSFMEALSCGIPIIACDVGGVSEIVNDQNGFLLAKDFILTEAREIISNVNDKRNKFDPMRIMLEAKAKFDKEKNYSKFFNL